MKAIFRCEYCDKLGTLEEIEKHEEVCLFNYTKKSCYTCKQCSLSVLNKITCASGLEVPIDHVMQNCDAWVWDEKTHTSSNPFCTNSMFGGIFL